MENKENESAKALWENFKMHFHDLPDDYDVWAFGDSKEMADELSGLVLEGLKTATSSALELYADNEQLPEERKYSIILDGNDQAVGIIQTLKVRIYSFNAVPDEIAYEEGEGDRTLAYWREVHEAFFIREMQKAGKRFSTEMKVICEQFELVYAA